MLIILDTVIVLISIIALWRGAVWMVEASATIAAKLGLSEIIIGLTVVAFGTSAPEFAVTILAALRDQGDISVGNIVGSNIFNLGFILGGVACILAVKTTRKLVFRDGLILLGSSILLIFFLFDYTISRLEGMILFFLLFLYLFIVFMKKEPLEEIETSAAFHWSEIPRLLGGLVLIIGGGYFLVDSASDLARVAGLSEWLIGISIVAAGTSAPEFVTSLVAVLRNKHGISAGNLIGSNIFNTLGVLGLAGAIHPMVVDRQALMSLIMLTILVAFVLIAMRSGWRISRLEGAVLILLNLLVYVFSIV
jgi:cation:H+ antiporter